MLFASIDDGILAAGTFKPQAIDVDFDATFLIQLVLFVALTLILKPLLFDPMLKLFEEREKLTDGAKAQARKMDEKSATALAEYEAAMAKARAAANVERERVRAEGLKREAEILAAVRTSTTKVLEDGKKTAQAEAQRARASLKADAPKLAEELVERVLGRKVQS
ncbi:MAG TPA: ATP synthase F0 subunit B [Polyangiaceae bacterium]|jgi:F-type H+-transporting ATPase subunit b|nr:ATP synthase F0 subunit B [Polyangiaceae bacterium]